MTEPYKSLSSNESAPVCVNGTWSRPKKKKAVDATTIDINKTDSGSQDTENGESFLKTGSDSPSSSKPKPKAERRALCISILTLLLSIPALIGAWCWPALVIGLIGGTVTAAARAMGHYISFSITLAMLIAMIAYTAYGIKRREGTRWQKNGPLIFVCMAVPLIMADLLRHVLQDVGTWPEPGSSQYRDDCDAENVTCLTIVGVFFTIIMTYLGFTLLAIGTMWNANLCDKLREIRQKWRDLRSGNSEGSSEGNSEGDSAPNL